MDRQSKKPTGITQISHGKTLQATHGFFMQKGCGFPRGLFLWSERQPGQGKSENPGNVTHKEEDDDIRH